MNTIIEEYKKRKIDYIKKKICNYGIDRDTGERWYSLRTSDPIEVEETISSIIDEMAKIMEKEKVDAFNGGHEEGWAACMETIYSNLEKK